MPRGGKPYSAPRKGSASRRKPASPYEFIVERKGARSGMPARVPTRQLQRESLSGFGTTMRGSKRPGVRFKITEDHPLFGRRKSH